MKKSVPRGLRDACFCKFMVAAILLFTFLALVTVVAYAQDESGTPVQPLNGVVSSSLNPLQIALLHWYNANQTPTTFTAGAKPFGIAFDGANMWIADNGNNKVTKLRVTDGFSLGSFTVGSAPTTLAFDGANIWVANINSNNVTKLRGSDGF